MKTRNYIFMSMVLSLFFPDGVWAQMDQYAIQKQLAVHSHAGTYLMPALFVGYGLASLTGPNGIRNLDMSTRSELQEDHPLFSVHADNLLQYAPAMAVYTLQLSGLKGRHTLADATGLFMVSQSIMGGSVYSLKNIIPRLRPNGSGMRSFPSGHTATAFSGAEFLMQEYKDSSPWIGYAGYGIATLTGAMRMYNNRHWLSDVVAGAGIGILSAKAAYLFYPWLKHMVFKRSTTDLMLVPGYQNGGAGIAFHAIF